MIYQMREQNGKQATPLKHYGKPPLMTELGKKNYGAPLSGVAYLSKWEL